MHVLVRIWLRVWASEIDKRKRLRCVEEDERPEVVDELLRFKEHQSAPPSSL